MTTQLQRNDRASSPENETPVNPAETYERYMVSALFAPGPEQLLAVARPRSGERVLDVGLAQASSPAARSLTSGRGDRHRPRCQPGHAQRRPHDG